MRSVLLILDVLLSIYGFILLFRVLLSWVRLDRDNPLVNLLYVLTEPILEPIRALLPQTGMMDFSPLIAMILIFVLRQLLTILAY